MNHFAVGPTDGGGTRHFELARELRHLNWDVTIAASDLNLQSRMYSRRKSASERSPISETIDGIEFLWLYASPYRRNDWRRLANWLSFADSLRRVVKGQTWDVVIGSSPHLFAALAAERVAKRMRVPFLLEVRDLWPESITAAGGKQGPFYYSLELLARYLYARAQHIIVLANGSRTALERRGIHPDRVSVVPNGVDVTGFGPPLVREGKLSLVYAGAHGPANGLEVVLDCADILRDRHDISFRLVGDGPSKAMLKRRAEQGRLTNVEFLDPVPKSAIPATLAAADAGLMVLRDAPLFAYGVSPNKLFDYFAASLPVICNVAGETAGIVEAAGAGEVALPGSARSLADAVLRLADCTAAERQAMGRAGRAWVERERDRPVLAKRLDVVLRGVIAQS